MVSCFFIRSKETLKCSQKGWPNCHLNGYFVKFNYLPTFSLYKVMHKVESSSTLRSDCRLHFPRSLGRSAGTFPETVAGNQAYRQWLQQRCNKAFMHCLLLLLQQKGDTRYTLKALQQRDYQKYLFIYLFVCLFCCCQGPGTAQIGEGGDNSWIVLDDDDEEEMEDNDEIKITDVQKKPKTATQTSQQKNGSKGKTCPGEAMGLNPVRN